MFSKFVLFVLVCTLVLVNVGCNKRITVQEPSNNCQVTACTVKPSQFTIDIH